MIARRHASSPARSSLARRAPLSCRRPPARQQVSEVPEALRFEQVGEHRHRFPIAGDPEARELVFGGQLLAQMIIASAARTPLEVKSIHAIFARAARVSGEPLELEVDSMHAGRIFGSDTVTVWQGARLCARSMILLHSVDPDIIHHSPPMPETTPPEDVPVSSTGMVFPGAEARIVGGPRFWAPEEADREATLFVWTRYPEAPDDLAVNQAALAWATNGLLIGTAMRPHADLDQEQAHRSVSTGVISHTITFHEPFSARRWLLLAQESPYAGRGRSHGRAHVFTREGRLVASYIQESMIRAVPEGQALDSRTAM